MSRLRAAVAASALTAGEPGAVLGRWTGTAPASRGRCATVAYALVATEPDTGRATVNYSCAGHPYPLLVFPDHRAVFLTSGRRLPVAIKEHDARSYPPDATATAQMPPGSLILLYTDGLVERAGETLDDGLARLEAAAAECADLPVEAVCTELLSRMAPPTGYRDDVVVLALRPSHQAPRSFATVVTSAPKQIPVARERLRDWLAGLAVAPKRELDILLATGEAVTNAIEHGSDGEPRRTVSVEAFVRRQTIAVTVSDTGRWVGIPRPACAAGAAAAGFPDRWAGRSRRHAPHSRGHPGHVAVRPGRRDRLGQARPLPWPRPAPPAACCGGCSPASVRRR